MSNPVNPRVRPWTRFWARLFDVSLFGLLFSFAAIAVFALLAPKSFFWKATSSPFFEPTLAAVMLAAWVFIEALLLSRFGTTPGKWLFRIRLVPATDTVPTYAAAFGRSFKVWWRGLGLGLPIVSLLTLVTAYYLLKGNSTTSWDREGGFTVEHGRIGVSRTLAAVVCFAAIIIFAVTDPAALAPPRLAEESQSGTTEFFDKGVAAYLAGNHQAAMEYYALDFRASRSPVTAANLCNLHLYGRDVPQNQAAALELCSFAAEHNEPNALIMLGEMYISGVGVTPDEQKAISYFRRGAEIGHVHGQFVMGLLLLESESIQDAKKAIGWFEKAHLGGHPLAKARLIEARLRVAQGTKE